MTRRPVPEPYSSTDQKAARMALVSSARRISGGLSVAFVWFTTGRISLASLNLGVGYVFR